MINALIIPQICIGVSFIRQSIENHSEKRCNKSFSIQIDLLERLKCRCKHQSFFTTNKLFEAENKLFQLIALVLYTTNH